MVDPAIALIEKLRGRIDEEKAKAETAEERLKIATGALHGIDKIVNNMVPHSFRWDRESLQIALHNAFKELNNPEPPA